MKAAARRRGLLENFKKLKRNKQVTFFRKKPGRGKGNGKQQEDLSDIVKINIGIMVPDSGHLKRVRGKSLTVNVPRKYNSKHDSRGWGGEAQSTRKRYSHGTDFVTTASAFYLFILALNFSTLPSPAANFLWIS